MVIRCKLCDSFLKGPGIDIKPRRIEGIEKNVIVCPECGLVHDEEGDVIQVNGKDVYVHEDQKGGLRCS